MDYLSGCEETRPTILHYIAGLHKGQTKIILGPDERPFFAILNDLL